MKKLIPIVILLTLLLFSSCTSTKDLSYWTDDSEVAKNFNDYLSAITDINSPDFVPVEDRVAVFDLDGTLMCETCPWCFEYMVFADYALSSPDVASEIKEVAKEIIDSAWGEKPSGMSTRQATAGAIAYKGMSMDELREVVHKFRNTFAEGFSGMTRGEAYYLPMLEIFSALKANEFDIYIVTATERNIVRYLIEGYLDIPYSHVIGTEYGYEATGQGDVSDSDYSFKSCDKIVFDGNYYGENAKTSKVDSIVREIGKQPILAFGNSSGDESMEIYTISGNKYRSAAYMILADDSTREYGSEDNALKRELYENKGITVISMKDDWKTIYGEHVLKTPLSGNSEVPPAILLEK